MVCIREGYLSHCNFIEPTESVLVFFGTTGPFPQLPQTTQFKTEMSVMFWPIAILSLSTESLQ